MNLKSTPYPRVHKTFKREFKALRDWIRSTNRYDLKKITGKENMFESEKKDGERSDRKLTIRNIEGCDLTRIKENKSSFAIGDKDGNPITKFEFIYVSKEVVGRKNKLIEVITKDGDGKYFNVSKRVLNECDGMGVGTIGGAAPSSSSSNTETNGSGAEIQYSDVKDEILTPIKGKVPLLYGGVKNDAKRKNKKYVSRI